MSEPLDRLRADIDAIDDGILALLEQRAELALEVATAKQAAGLAAYYDPERERRIVARLDAASRGRLSGTAVHAVFREIISACLSLQQPLRVAYLGPEGTFTQLAARELFGRGAEYRDATTIFGVFDAVARGHAARGVVPIENSSEGSVASTLRALVQHELLIERELVLDIRHCLLTRATALSDVTRVHSHPQALGQCSAWLQRNLPMVQVLPTASTAAAVIEALADPGSAALGSSLAGDLYGLPTLVEKVQDEPDNATRFVVVSPRDAARTGDDKTTLAFRLGEGPGELRRALEAFEAEGVDLARIESQPSRERAWAYLFSCDLAGHRDDGPIQAAIARLQASGAWVKLLGSYPRAGAR